MKIATLPCISLKVFSSVVLRLLLFGLVPLASAQKEYSQQSIPSPIVDKPDVNHVISEFTNGETEFRNAISHYGYKCDMIVHTVNNGKVTGEYHRTTQIVLGKDGKLKELVLSFPKPSLTDVAITREDLEDLSADSHFTLGSPNADKYIFTYVGSERVSNFDLYVFDVKPKSISSKGRLFDGRIWVSVSNLKIVKMRGRSVEKGNQSFPIMESYRDAVDGRYLFPSYAFADEELNFKTGGSAHLRIEVRYTDYVKLQ